MQHSFCWVSSRFAFCMPSSSTPLSLRTLRALHSRSRHISPASILFAWPLLLFMVLADQKLNAPVPLRPTAQWSATRGLATDPSPITPKLDALYWTSCRHPDLVTSPLWSGRRRRWPTWFRRYEAIKNQTNVAEDANEKSDCGLYWREWRWQRVCYPTWRRRDNAACIWIYLYAVSEARHACVAYLPIICALLKGNRIAGSCIFYLYSACIPFFTGRAGHSRLAVFGLWQ